MLTTNWSFSNHENAFLHALGSVANPKRVHAGSLFLLEGTSVLGTSYLRDPADIFVNIVKMSG